MFKANLEIHFISDWHIGSGLGDGAVADAVLNRDVHGIPCIPGSAIKGALREGAWRLARCSQDLSRLPVFLFGTASSTSVSNQPGRLTAGQGDLDPRLRDWLLAQADLTEFVRDMTVIHQQTSLDAHKQVVPRSLRSFECGIPGLVFGASISVAVPAQAHAWLRDYLGAVCACVKSVGGYRSRGIGRCRLVLDGASRPALPGSVPAILQTLLESVREDENS